MADKLGKERDRHGRSLQGHKKMEYGKKSLGHLHRGTKKKEEHQIMNKRMRERTD